MDWTVRRFEELNNRELYQILQLRINVFMLEQNCLYTECDDKDYQAKHLFGTDNGCIVAYARLLPPLVSYNEPAIGRVVVHPQYRALKIGHELMVRSIAQQHIDYPFQAIRISAQARLQTFYENLGFEIEGETYLEDDIPHIGMILSPSHHI